MQRTHRKVSGTRISCTQDCLLRHKRFKWSKKDERSWPRGWQVRIPKDGAMPKAVEQRFGVQQGINQELGEES